MLGQRSLLCAALYLGTLLARAGASVVYELEDRTKHAFSYERNLDCTKKSDVIRLFRDQGKICVASPVWRLPGGIKSNGKELFDGDEQKLTTALLFFSNYAHTGQYEDSLDTERLRLFLSNLSDQDLSLLKFHEQFGIIQMLTEKQLKSIDPNYISHAIMKCSTIVSLLSIIKNLHPSIVEDHFEVIIEKIRETGMSLTTLDDAFLQRLLESPERCKALGLQPILTLGYEKEKAKLMTPACFAAIEVDPASDECTRSIRYFPDDVFSLVHKPMHETCFEHMLKEKLENYGKGLDDQSDRCTSMRLEHLNIQALPSMPAVCLQNWLVKAANPVTLGAKWSLLPEGVFEAFLKGDVEDGIKRIDLRDWMHIRGKEQFVKNPEVCQYLPAEFFMYNGRVPVSNECFEQLTAPAKSAALLHAILPDNALAKVDTFSDWTATSKTGATVTGIHVLNLADDVENIGCLIHQLSSADSGSHACSEVSSIGDFQEMHVLQEHCTIRCIEALPDKLTLENLPKLHARIATMVSFDEIMASLGEGDWSSLPADQFEALMNTGKLCKTLSAKTISTLTEDCVAVMSAECVRDLAVLSELDAAVFASMPTAAFRLVDSTQVKTIDLAKLSDEQFSELGVEIPRAQNVAAHWTKDTIAAMSATRVAAISAIAWEHAAPDAYAGLSVEQLKAIRPEAMTGMSAEQVAQIPEATIEVLSEVQAHKIGKDAQDGQCPLATLRERKLSDPVKTVILNRQ